MNEIALEPSGRLPVTLVAFADPPLPGRCLPHLLEGFTAAWAAGLYAAMLRDTLDGLQSLGHPDSPDRTEHVVVASCDDDEGWNALERHVPSPWRIAHEAIEPRAELVVHEIPTALLVRSPIHVTLLVEELRRHPERAPRTADCEASPWGLPGHPLVTHPRRFVGRSGTRHGTPRPG